MSAWEGWELGRAVVVFAAIAYVVVWVQVSLSHWAAGFRRRAMWVPVLLTPVIVLGALVGALSRQGPWGWIALALLALGVVDGLVGLTYHLRGTASHRRSFAATLTRGGEGIWGERLMRHLREYPSFAVLGTEGECLSYETNRVELSDDVDEFAVPRPLVTFDYGANEKAMRAEIHRIGREILEAASAEEVVISEGNDHTMGGCRMGRDPAASVVDADLRAHGHPNLYVCDASVFVTPGGAQPSQTIMALATRLADHLARGRADPRGAATTLARAA